MGHRSPAVTQLALFVDIPLQKRHVISLFILNLGGFCIGLLLDAETRQSEAGQTGLGKNLVAASTSGSHLILFLHPFFLSCDPAITPGRSGILTTLLKLTTPIFCRGDRGAIDVDEFAFEVKVWLPRSTFINLLAIDAQMLLDVVHRKKSSAGIDVWDWREFKTLSLIWFDGLATFLNRVEEDGVWPEELLDAYLHSHDP